MAVQQVAPGVWSAGTRFVNWYLVDGGDGLTVVDAGFPKYGFGKALTEIGRTPADVRAVLLTHGHVDHTGMAAAFAQVGATVHLHEADRSLADGSRPNRPEKVLPYLLWPATLGFVAHALQQGARQPPAFPATRPLEDGAEVDVPGRPVVTHVPGHTDGSVVLEFREHGVVFAGDLLCTVDPFSGRTTRPQLQSRGSNADSGAALRALDRLAGIEARTVLPGHGRPWTDGVEAAVASARQIGCR